MYKIVLFYVLLVWDLYVSSEQKFNMYNTDHHQQDGYCMLYYVRNTFYISFDRPSHVLMHQIIPYCLRSLEENIADINVNDTGDPSFTFEELRDKNITSQQLLSWSAPIDLTEQYQMYLTNTSLWSSPAKEFLFYNCTLPWFGPYCAFAFDPLSNMSLDQYVLSNFPLKLVIEPRSNSSVSCYEHLKCKTSLRCLDWREICDRKADCFDGSDEFNCWQLEINECAQNEYRCHNGQCIPDIFFRDDRTSPDCQDQTDEAIDGYLISCIDDPRFRCEEHTCPPNRNNFPCGDGSCIHETSGLCMNGRNNLLLLNDNCSIAMSCLMFQSIDRIKELCKIVCLNETCIKDYCPSIYEYSSISNVLGHIRLVFNITQIEIEPDGIPVPNYICYNEDICADFLPTTIHFNDLTCRSLAEVHLIVSTSLTYLPSFDLLIDSIKRRFSGCLIISNETYYCNYSTMYQCQNSTKCISKHRLVDTFEDCPLGDDETIDYSCSLNDAHLRRQCTIGENKRCVAPFIENFKELGCEDEHENNLGNGIDTYDKHIYFQRICDGKPDLITMTIDGYDETDETECEEWPCNNTYTRCDRFWSCKNGADEVNCPNSICPEFHHSCIFPSDPLNLSCLPISRAGDGIVDCLGASDERKVCRGSYLTAVVNSWQCLNTTSCLPLDFLCDFNKNCLLGDDESFCSYHRNIQYLACQYSSSWLENEKHFCDLVFGGFTRSLIPFFKISNMPTFSSIVSTNDLSVVPPGVTKTMVIQDENMDQFKNIDQWRCNRGLPIYIRIRNDTKNQHCLCPPSYYGDKCQYQNQRVSLTLKIQATSDWLDMSILVLILVDHEENIQSHDYIEYFPVRDCESKYNVYLLYSTRPKNPSKNYSVRIHAFNKLTLKYRSSWIFSIQYPFLPVYRLAVKLTIPFVDNQLSSQCILPCIHGRCFNNVNNPNSTFCLCDSGWSGIQCNISYTCDCASGSRCLDASICICPSGRFGPRCYLLQPPCSSEICSNRGQCILSDQRYALNNTNKLMCICSEEYYGDHCQYRQTRIHVSFDHKLPIPSFIIVHFITVQQNDEHIRTSLLKKLPYEQNSLSFYSDITFHIAIAETSNNYYLIVLQEKGIISANVSTEVTPVRQCLSIHELFDKTRANQHLLKRIKYYHIPCKERLDLVCFYDDVYICLCNLDRQANCFEFKHNMTYDCYGYNYCENDGQCFRDNSKCPRSSSCACPDCYFGSKCQFSTKSSTISLDVIIGYYINPNLRLNQQPIIVKVSIVFTTIIFTFGLISNVLSLLTFQMQSTRNIGCGLYLFAISIISMLIMIMLTLKVGLLLAFHMNSISLHSFMYAQCLSIDYLIRFLLSTNDWLSACVAIDRAVNVSKGVSFDKTKSKQMAKWIIPFVCLFNLLSYIHDPIHRHLIDDNEEQRTWCVVKYSLTLQLFDWIVNIIHFSSPFAINLISALIIIILATRIRSNSHKNQSYKNHLREQCQHHKHLLISPFILVLLAVPRLIISFLSGCMKSARNPWLYLVGYFISFIPPMLTFIVFVLPSETYRKAFKNSVERFWRRSPNSQI